MPGKEKIKVVETPRDGMQGLEHFIPTSTKIAYINLLLKCGFHVVEVGSFVSPRAIPQMADTADVLKGLDFRNKKSAIAVLVANLKGGILAADFDVVDELFYPFSTSPTFLHKNLNTTLAEAEKTVADLQNLCIKKNKELVTFISLAFGDPYGDPWHIELVMEWVEKLVDIGIKKIPLADTIGDVDPALIDTVCGAVVPGYPGIEFGLHTHAFPGKGKSKIAAAWKHGIRRFDTVIGGLGGCPNTDKELVGNLSLESLITWSEMNDVDTGLDLEMVKTAQGFPLLGELRL